MKKKEVTRFSAKVQKFSRANRLLTITGIQISFINFSNAELRNIRFRRCTLDLDLTSSELNNVSFEDSYLRIKFNHSRLDNTQFYGLTIAACDFSNLVSMNKLRFLASSFLDFEFPMTLAQKNLQYRATNFTSLKTVLDYADRNHEGEDKTFKNIRSRSLHSLTTFIESGLDNKLFTKKELNESFEFLTTEDRDFFVEHFSNVNKKIFNNIRANKRGAKK
jgi:hypothetical protein